MKIILCGLFALIVLSGCSTGDTVQETLSQLPEAQTFLENNPDAVVTQSFLEGREVANFLSKLREDCGDFPLAAAWEVVYRSAEQEMIVYLNREGNTITCIVRPGEVPGNECRIDQECDDGREITTDACTGTPRTCIHSYRLCREVNGKECAATETCSENALKAADTEACCVAKCIGRDPCSDIACAEGFMCRDGKCENTDTSLCANVQCAPDQTCVNGLCEQQSCEQLQGYLCVGNFYCAGQAHSSIETAVCCIQECTEETCAHRGGQVCASGQTCIGDIEQVQDTPVCCVGECVVS